MDQTTLAGMSVQAFAAISALVVLCMIAGWLDLRERRIPNWLCGVTAIAGLLSGVLLGDGLSGLGSHALHLVLALAGGMILFSFGVFGGGDAKFYAAAAAWFPLSKAMLLLMMVALIGLALLIVWFTCRRVRGFPVRKLKGTGFDGLPYGIAIGTGAVAALII
jgi:prepilin peptidase CpaA